MKQKPWRADACWLIPGLILTYLSTAKDTSDTTRIELDPPTSIINEDNPTDQPDGDHCSVEDTKADIVAEGSTSESIGNRKRESLSLAWAPVTLKPTHSDTLTHFHQGRTT